MRSSQREPDELSEDAMFDQVYPRWVRRLSGQYWTPVAVARKAADMLLGGDAGRVLDVGSGSGKMCIVGALETGAEFVGVEQDKRLVQVAREVGAHYGADKATFVHGDAKDVDWLAFDAFYLFNPFVEYWGRRAAGERKKLERRREADVAFCTEMLDTLPSGARVVTYHGFGGQMPLGYRRRRTVFFGEDRLELWIRE